jgi:hypothetical protein
LETLKERRKEEAKRNRNAKVLWGSIWALFVDWIDWGGLTIVMKLFTIVPRPQTTATTKTLNNGRATMQK